MFKVFDQLIVTWPVRVDLGDGTEKRLSDPIDVEFEILPNDEMIRLDAAGGWDAIFRRVVRGWNPGQLADRDGSPLAFTPANLTRLLTVPRVVHALQAAYYEAASGVRRKNS